MTYYLPRWFNKLTILKSLVAWMNYWCLPWNWVWDHIPPIVMDGSGSRACARWAKTLYCKERKVDWQNWHFFWIWPWHFCWFWLRHFCWLRFLHSVDCDLDTSVDCDLDIFQIMTDETEKCSNPLQKTAFCQPNIDVSNFLNLNSLTNHDAFCLAYIFTYRDFSQGTLGLAWVGSPSGNRTCFVYGFT